MMSDRSRDDFDRLMTSWMEDEARNTAPEGLVDAALSRTTVARRRPRWLVADWWLPMGLPGRHVVRRQQAPLILAVVALVLVTAMLVLLAGGRRQVPAPFGVAGNGRLVVDTNGSIDVVDIHDLRTHPLVEGVTLAAGASFSRDGTRLVFWGDNSPDTLYIANADGSGVRPLVGGLWIATDKSPAWSPDGRHVAISTESGPDRGDEYLVVIDTENGTSTRVDAPALTEIRALLPAWSPDGAWIAFIGIPRRASRPSLWLIHPDGTAARELPTSELDAYSVVAPRWAPDAAHLRLAYSARGGETIAAEVFDLVSDGEIPMSRDETGLWPAWSPDGAWLAWLTDPSVGDVRIASSDGSGESRLIRRTGIGGPPAWSPDGRELFGPAGSGSSLVLVTIDGSASPVRIPHDPSQAAPDWQRVSS